MSNVLKYDLLEKGIPFSSKSLGSTNEWPFKQRLCLEIKDLKSETDSLVIYFFIMMELLFGQRPILGKINKKDKVTLSLVCDITKDNLLNFIYILKIFRCKGVNLSVVSMSKNKIIFSVKNFFVLRPLPGKLWGRFKGFDLLFTLSLERPISIEEKNLFISLFQLY